MCCVASKGFVRQTGLQEGGASSNFSSPAVVPLAALTCRFPINKNTLCSSRSQAEALDPVPVFCSGVKSKVQLEIIIWSLHYITEHSNHFN